MRQYFRKNMGTTDRIVRISFALLFFILYFSKTVTGTFGMVLLVLGIAFVIISLFSFCPFYPLLGISTCKKKS